MLLRMLFVLLVAGVSVGVLAQSSQPAPDTRVLRGRVVTDDGFATPLRGARVATLSDDGAPAAETSDGQGWFAARVPAQGDWSITVTKAGYAPATLTRAELTGEPAVVRMTRGAVITGRVIDERGEPVPGVTVAVRPEACADPCAADGNSPSGAFVSFAETDDLGEYRIGSLAAGRYEVRHTQTGPGMAGTTTFRELSGNVVVRSSSDTRMTPSAVVQLRAGEETTLHLSPQSGANARLAASYVAGFNAGAATASRENDASRSAERAGGTLRGRITAPSGLPVSGANVRIALVGGTARRMASSDADGRYAFDRVPPGTYELSVTSPGFPPVQYGQQRTTQPGTTITVREGSTLDGIDVRLPPGGVITGRVVDAFGEPLQDVAVQVLQQRFKGGRTVLEPASGAAPRTDDRGYYRAYGLLPGTYYVAASDNPAGNESGGVFRIGAGSWSVASVVSFSSSGQSLNVTASALPGGPRVFHPGSLSVATAAPIRIEPGLDAFGVDIALGVASAARIRGVALDAAGQPVRGMATLTVSQRSRMPIPPAASVAIAEDGTFEFRHVAPGEYVVQVATGPVFTLYSAAADGRNLRVVHRVDDSSNDSPEFGMQFVTVSETDDVALSIRTAPGTTLRGRVVVDGGDSSVSHAGFAVAVVPADPDRSPASMQPRAALDDQLRFELPGLTGPVRLTLAQAPQGWYLKSALINGIDAAEYPVTLGTPGQAVGSVDAVVARGGEISGRVVDERGQPAAGASVVVFSTDPTRWYDRSQYLKLTRPTQDGEFSVSSLPPGEYWVTAVDRIVGDATSGEWQDPDLLSRLSAGARRVRVDAAQQAQTEVRLVRTPW